MEKKIAVITGSSGGLGQGLCSVFSKAGYYVVGIDRHELHDNCDSFINLDIRKIYREQEVRDSLLEQLETIAAGSGIKALINNAAVQILNKTEDITEADWDETIETNLLAPFKLIQILLPYLEKAKGNIVNICSIHAIATKPKFVCYATSKAALSGLTRVLAVDLGPRVRINAINLAACATPMLLEGFKDHPEKLLELEQMHPLERIGTVEEAAKVCLFLVSDDASFINGASWLVDGGIGGRLHDPV